MGQKKYRWLLGVVGIHLVFCLLGATSFRFGEIPKVGRVLEWYSEFSGAASNFGFFAPGVDSQVRARFDVIDAHGNKVDGALADSDLSHEAQLRVANIVDQFQELQGIADEATDDEDEAEDYGDELAQNLAASLAGKIFARYPRARRVKVHLDNYDAISMDDWRRGVRPKWVEMYSVTFAMKKPAQTEAAR